MAYDQRRPMCGPQVRRSNYNTNVDGISTSSVSSANGFWRQNSGGDGSRKLPSHLVHVEPDTFWTYCRSCFVNFQYSKEYVNQHLRCPVCRAVFVAIEVPPPNSPVYPNGQNPVAANNNVGGTAVSNRATPGMQAGVAPGNQNVKRKEAGEADTATNEESNIHRKVLQTVRKHARANVATKEHEAAKRRCVNDVKTASWQRVSSRCDGDLRKPGVPFKRKPRFTTEISRAKKPTVSSGDLGESSSNAARTSFGRVFLQLETRGILIENMKLQLQEKLKAFNIKDSVKNEDIIHICNKSTTNIASGAAIDVNRMTMKQRSRSVLSKEDDTTKLVSKRVDSQEQTEKKSKQISLEQKGKLCRWRSPHIVYTRRNRKENKKEQADNDRTGANSATKQHLASKHGCLNQEPSSDEGSSEMPVPDADFYNFGDHLETSFQNDQVWAVYDDEDGMPRYYALIRKVLSTHPFKVRLAYLKANDLNEFGASKWISCGYSKTCGEFKAGLSKDAEQLNMFSHKVNYEKGQGSVIRIFPKKGDIWALYQNWSSDWNEFTPDDTMYKYKLVEVLDSYSPIDGVSVMPIEKIPEFVAVFKPLGDATKILRIQTEEMLRFSHQVPFHVLTGEEAPNAPKGCYELDPGSTPKELLQNVAK